MFGEVGGRERMIEGVNTVYNNSWPRLLAFFIKKDFELLQGMEG